MKSIKHLFICLLSVSVLVNCGGNESKRAKTPVTPQVTLCQLNPADCPTPGTGPGPIATGEVRVYQSTNMNVYNPDQYDRFLKSVYGSCDIPQVYLTPNIVQTILLSGLASAANRCSKWNDRGYLELALGANGQSQVHFGIQSSYLGGSFSKTLINQNINLLPIKNDTAYEAQLGSNSSNFQQGLSMEVQGDFNSNQLTVFIDYFGEEIVNFTLNRVR